MHTHMHAHTQVGRHARTHTLTTHTHTYIQHTHTYTTHVHTHTTRAHTGYLISCVHMPMHTLKFNKGLALCHCRLRFHKGGSYACYFLEIQFNSYGTLKRYGNLWEGALRSENMTSDTLIISEKDKVECVPHCTQQILWWAICSRSVTQYCFDRPCYSFIELTSNVAIATSHPATVHPQCVQTMSWCNQTLPALCWKTWTRVLEYLLTSHCIHDPSLGRKLP